MLRLIQIWNTGSLRSLRTQPKVNREEAKDQPKANREKAKDQPKANWMQATWYLRSLRDLLHLRNPSKPGKVSAGLERSPFSLGINDINSALGFYLLENIMLS